MEKSNETQSAKTSHPHYYGTLVRKQLFFAAFVILLAALIDRELRNFYLVVGLFGVVGLTILAGLTSPQKRGIMFTDMFVSAIMFLIFEYFAINAFVKYGTFSDPIFFFRQLIAVIYLVTLYYSTKTLRYYDDKESSKQQ
ncbi:MAG TPA: hypothetical protein DCS23_03875 [Candidatus Yonathbacteria bacterium]|nr:hypothetical protein [Candidatus Yonathbacteria bacterium]